MMTLKDSIASLNDVTAQNSNSSTKKDNDPNQLYFIKLCHNPKTGMRHQMMSPPRIEKRHTMMLQLKILIPHQMMSQPNI